MEIDTPRAIAHINAALVALERAQDALRDA
jgi:hypothetical protein